MAHKNDWQKAGEFAIVALQLHKCKYVNMWIWNSNIIIPLATCVWLMLKFLSLLQMYLHLHFRFDLLIAIEIAKEFNIH